MSRRPYLALSAGLMLMILFTWQVPVDHTICEQSPTTGIGHCSSYRIPPYLFFKVLDLTNYYNGAITAFATVAIGIFTLMLKRSTDNLWLADKEKFEASDRAFVFINGFNYELTTALESLLGTENMPAFYRTPETRGLYVTRFACQPRWRNSGATPTKNMKILVHWGQASEQVPPRYNSPPHTTKERWFFVGPGATEPGDFIDMSAAPMGLINWSLHPIPPEPILLVWGRADYEDVFGKSHFTEWCYRIRPERHTNERMTVGFMQWGDYNRTD